MTRRPRSRMQDIPTTEPKRRTRHTTVTQPRLRTAGNVRRTAPHPAPDSRAASLPHSGGHA